MADRKELEEKIRALEYEKAHVEGLIEVYQREMDSILKRARCRSHNCSMIALTKDGYCGAHDPALDMRD